MEGHDKVMVVEARRQPDTASEDAHSETVSENEGAMESMNTEREEPFEILPAPSFAKN